MLRTKMDVVTNCCQCSDDTLLNRDWARYIIAQKGVVGREWQWKCDGVESVGFMIYKPSPNNEDEDEERDENDLEKAIKALEEEIQGDVEKKDDEQSRSGWLQIEIRFTKRIQQTKPAGILQPPSLLSEFGLEGCDEHENIRQCMQPLVPHSLHTSERSQYHQYVKLRHEKSIT